MSKIVIEVSLHLHQGKKCIELAYFISQRQKGSSHWIYPLVIPFDLQAVYIQWHECFFYWPAKLLVADGGCSNGWINCTTLHHMFHQREFFHFLCSHEQHSLHHLIPL